MIFFDSIKSILLHRPIIMEISLLSCEKSILKQEKKLRKKNRRKSVFIKNAQSELENLKRKKIVLEKSMA